MMMLRATVVVMGIHIHMVLGMKKVEEATHICMVLVVDAEVEVGYRLNSL